jgi:hypothetical protein
MAKKTAAKSSPRRKATKSIDEIASDICFTIMPFGGFFDKYYAEIYKPAITSSGLTPKRADDLYRPSTIVNDIWAYTRSAKLILADLTGKNPNVFYELGLAHALAKPAILVAESIDDVPFDLRALRVLEYDKNEPNWGDSLREKISKSISEIVTSPLQSVLPAFLETREQNKTPKITEQDRINLELRQDLDLLRGELRRARLSSSSSPERSMGPEEAEDNIRRDVGRGMPVSMVVDRMTRYGVPESFVRDNGRQVSATVGISNSNEEARWARAIKR